VLPRWEGDLTAVLTAAAQGSLGQESPQFADRAAVCVVLATDGYPVSPRTGDVIDGLEEVAGLPDLAVYSAGVGRDTRGRLVTAGGRVLGVTGLGAGIGEARDRAYAAVAGIDWPGMQYRRDIAEAATATTATATTATATTAAAPDRSVRP
jgi:phosphoribosylamine--glycine ligase